MCAAPGHGRGKWALCTVNINMGRLLVSLLIASALALGACANAGTAAGEDANSAPADAGIDATPPRRGHNASATVPGGVKASSPSYKLIGTSGKSDNSLSSPNYTVRDGVVGASQE